MSEATRIARLLGGRNILGIEVTKIDDLVSLIRRGLPVEAMSCLEASTGLERRLLGKWLMLSNRVLARRFARGHLTPYESDRAVRIARVFVRAEEVLNSQEKARRWLRYPNRALGMVSPGSFLDTNLGAQLIMDALGRVEHGTFG